MSVNLHSNKYNKCKADGYTQVSAGNVLIDSEDDTLVLGLIFSDTLPANTDEPEFIFKHPMRNEQYPSKVPCYAIVLNNDYKEFSAIDN